MVVVEVVMVIVAAAVVEKLQRKPCENVSPLYENWLSG